MQVFEP